jgi:hypothetical protein
MHQTSLTVVDALRDSLVQEAEHIFSESPYHSMRGLRCEFNDGTLTIAGLVPNFYLKQLAQIAVQHLDGVRRIRNLIEVAV